MKKKRFKVYDKTRPSQSTYFKLADSGGDIELQVVDRDGAWLTDILTINDNGTIVFQKDIDDSLGLNLNKDGSIVCYTED